jgi:hypothetical protein
MLPVLKEENLDSRTNKEDSPLGQTHLSQEAIANTMAISGPLHLSGFLEVESPKKESS